MAVAPLIGGAVTKTLCHIAALCLALAAAPALAAETARAPAAASAVRGDPAHFDRAGHWRAARWGMTLAQILTAFAGEARALDRPVKLQDGNLVAAAIPAYDLEDQAFVVRFVFAKDALALVSLRTPEDRYAKPEVYEKMARWLDGRFGKKGEEGKDDNFVDLRQTRWRLPESQVDLKYIPGVVVILYSPAGSP